MHAVSDSVVQRENIPMVDDAGTSCGTDPPWLGVQANGRLSTFPVLFEAITPWVEYFPRTLYPATGPADFRHESELSNCLNL